MDLVILSLIVVFCVFPVQLSAKLFGAEISTFGACLIAVIIGSVLAWLSMFFIGQFLGILVAGVCMSLAFMGTLKLGFVGAMGTTISSIAIQIFVLYQASSLLKGASLELLKGLGITISS